MNLLFSENLQSFDESRNDFTPYHFSCETWTPKHMKKPDRHNEIEINFIPEGEITYLIHGKKVTIPKKTMAIFWGLVPHQIVHFAEKRPYLVITLPLTIFMEWGLPAAFLEKIKKGEIILEESGDHSDYDSYLMKSWVSDFVSNQNKHLILLEIQARVSRMAERVKIHLAKEEEKKSPETKSRVEQIALLIAQNYRRKISSLEIAQTVNLHPDYANMLFKKSFGMTINEYLTQERVAHAQRKLITTQESITEILFESGFNSVSRFNAAFQKISQCTPREYRKKHLQ